MNKENDLQKNVKKTSANKQRCGQINQDGKTAPPSSLYTDSDYSKWLESELDALVQKYEDFITTSSNRNYFSR